MNNKHQNICYFCGIELNETTKTREHVPAKCFFPKNSKNLITVPSCKEHNGGKSGDDEYLLLISSIHILANNDGKNIAIEKSVKSILRNKKLKKELNETRRTAYIENLNDGKIEETYAFDVDTNKIETAIKAIARGLYFHEFQEVFHGNIVISEKNFVRIPNEHHNKTTLKSDYLENVSNQLFENKEKKGENPRIFHYQINQDEQCTVIKICFYENISFTAWLKNTPRPRPKPKTKPNHLAVAVANICHTS